MNAVTQASYLIPFKSQNAERLENLVAVLSWLKASSALNEIILIEQDQSAQLESFAIKHGIRYCFDQCDTDFNKSRAFNVGVKIAQSNVMVLADADMLIEHDALQLCIQACATQAEAVNPYQYLVDTTQEQRNHFIETSVFPETDSVPGERQRLGEQLCFCGGIFLMRRETYLKIGGMDERFQGWGGEDDAMSLKLQLHSVSQLIKQAGIAYHLWHPRSPRRYQHSHYQVNLNLLTEYQSEYKKQLKKTAKKRS